MQEKLLSSSLSFSLLLCLLLPQPLLVWRSLRWKISWRGTRVTSQVRVKRLKQLPRDGRFPATCNLARPHQKRCIQCVDSCNCAIIIFLQVFLTSVTMQVLDELGCCHSLSLFHRPRFHNLCRHQQWVRIWVSYKRDLRIL